MGENDIIGKKADVEESVEADVKQQGDGTPTGGPPANEATGVPANAAHEEQRYLEDEARGIDAPQPRVGQRIDDPAQLASVPALDVNDEGDGDIEFELEVENGVLKRPVEGTVVGQVTVSDAFGTQYKITPGKRDAADVVQELEDRGAFATDESAEQHEASAESADEEGVDA